MNPKDAFDSFKRACEEARADSGKKKEMGRLFAIAIQSAGRTRRDITDAHIASRATIDRWFSGATVPHPAHIDNLEEFLIPKTFIGTSHHLAAGLLDPRYRPIIKFLSKKKLQVVL